MVQITEKEYNKLKESDRILRALEAAGVDNWEGYSSAFQDEDEED